MVIVLASACGAKTDDKESLGVQSADNNASDEDQADGGDLTASLKFSGDSKDFRDPLGNFTLKYPAGLTFKSVDDKRKVEFEFEDDDAGIVFETLEGDMETVDEELGKTLEYISRSQVTYDEHVGVLYTEASNALQVLIIPVDQSQTLKVTAEGAEYLEIFDMILQSLNWENS